MWLWSMPPSSSHILTRPSSTQYRTYPIFLEPLRIGTFLCLAGLKPMAAGWDHRAGCGVNKYPILKTTELNTALSWTHCSLLTPKNLTHSPEEKWNLCLQVKVAIAAITSLQLLQNLILSTSLSQEYTLTESPRRTSQCNFPRWHPFLLNHSTYSGPDTE